MIQDRKFASVAVQPLRISGVVQQQQQQQVAKAVKVMWAKIENAFEQKIKALRL